MVLGELLSPSILNLAATASLISLVVETEYKSICFFRPICNIFELHGVFPV